MRVSISLRLAQTDWAEASTYVTEAERLGVHDVWSAEAWGHDAVTPLAFMAARTSRIRLGTGIIQAGTRTPALVAQLYLSHAESTSVDFTYPSVTRSWFSWLTSAPVFIEVCDPAYASREKLSIIFKIEIAHIDIPCYLQIANQSF